MDLSYKVMGTLPWGNVCKVPANAVSLNKYKFQTFSWVLLKPLGAKESSVPRIGVLTSVQWIPILFTDPSTEH